MYQYARNATRIFTQGLCLHSRTHTKRHYSFGDWIFLRRRLICASVFRCRVCLAYVLLLFFSRFVDGILRCFSGCRVCWVFIYLVLKQRRWPDLWNAVVPFRPRGFDPNKFESTGHAIPYMKQVCFLIKTERNHSKITILRRR